MARIWSSVAWSAPHGDLGEPAACRALDASVEALLAQGGTVGISAIAHDLHPDFHSTRVAQALAERLGVPAIGGPIKVLFIQVLYFLLFASIPIRPSKSFFLFFLLFPEFV